MNKLRDELAAGYEEGRSDTRKTIRTGEVSSEYAYRTAKLAMWLGGVCGLVAFVVLWKAFGWGFLFSFGVAVVAWWAGVILAGTLLGLMMGALIRRGARAQERSPKRNIMNSTEGMGVRVPDSNLEFAEALSLIEQLLNARNNDGLLNNLLYTKADEFLNVARQSG